MATASEKQLTKLFAAISRQRDELDELVANPPKPLDFLDRKFQVQCDFIEDPSRLKVVLCTRRCLAEGTLVATPRGAVAIESLRVGDEVYDENGRVTKVVNTFDQGVLPVVTFANNGRDFVTATADHRFLVTHVRPEMSWRREMRLGDIYKGVKILRTETHAPMGDVDEPHAYVIGAFLGDGCKYPPDCSFLMSGQDESIVKKCADLSGASYKKCSGNNHSWLLQGTFNHFKEWMHGKYAHNKDIDFEVVKTWNRRSCLDFLAGLIDTDGSLTQAKDGPQLRISMQNKKVLDIARWMILSLWNVDTSLSEDNRDRYKNGSVWNLSLKHVYHVNRMMIELRDFIQCDRKKTFGAGTSQNYNPLYVGGTVREAGTAHCYDIEVANESHLFLLANGLVSHNSGKSFGDGIYAFKTAYENPRCSVVYFGLTRESAKRIMWKPVFEVLDDRYKIGATFNKSELSITLPNESVIYILGVDSGEKEMRKAFGQKHKLIIIDEAALYSIDLRELVYSVLQPSTADNLGTICLTGMPSNLKRGLFFDLTNGQDPCVPGTWEQVDEAGGAKWSGHRWSAFDNPYMAEIWAGEIAEKKKNNPHIEDTPKFQQEYLGRWAVDDDKLVYKYRAGRNDFDGELPEYERGSWHYVLVVDLGYEDDTSFTVLAYHDYDKNMYVLESWGHKKLDITAVAGHVHELDERYVFDEYVIDGSAKQSVEELRRRHQIPFKAADKAGKSDFIELMNGDFITGRIKLDPSRCSELIDEYAGLIWNDRSAKREEHPGCSNHRTDGVLYGWRRVYAYLADSPQAKVHRGTPEWYVLEAERMEENTRELVLKEQAEREEEDLWGY